MIQVFVDRFRDAEASLKEGLRVRYPESYDSLVKTMIETISKGHNYEVPDSERIHIIDDGDYQGTRLFVIGAKGYQPSTYWHLSVGYGSCSGCDSFEAIRDNGEYGTKHPNEKQVTSYYTMMLHMVEEMKEMS